MGVIRFPHPEFRRGVVTFGKKGFVSQTADIDATGDIIIGDFCMIGHYAKIFTHDHFHQGRIPLLLVQEQMGVKWLNKVIGNDVWLHECIILMQVTEIPDGVVIGAGSVLTKNPGSYEIWTGNPAIPTGYRTKYEDLPLTVDVNTELANYICGFVDGEGSFSITNNGGYPQFRFSIESDYRDKPLYDDIVSVFQCGHVCTRKRSERYPRMVTLTIGDFKGLIERVIPFFDNFKLRGLKLIKYMKWREEILNYVKENPLKKKLGER